ncbi:MAG TPA: ATPase [Verrucomicrobia bacterium]|nr:MAG: ATPase [Lentisphaerae bacterium GWF2_57_35]HBA85855.1 ATPase [Verrucomicrobiota bacterium]
MYLEFFGLTEMPFNITPDPRFLFFSTRHREAFDHLMYGIHNRKGFIELTGEVGSGKTTLCRALLSSLPSNVRTALVLNPSLTETQLLRAILNDFGLQVKGRDRLAYIERLNEFLLEQIKEGNNVLLIIDEAQDLIPEVMEQIRLLSNLETDQHKLMQIILAGQPELHERLARPEFRQLRQRIIVTCKLQPLDENDTAAYIVHRLSVAGASSEVVFDEGAIRMIYKFTVGTPRLINNVCDSALLAGYVAGTRIIRVHEIKKAIAHMESAL